MLDHRTNRHPITLAGRLWATGGLAVTTMIVGSLGLEAQTARIAGTVVDQAGHVVENVNVSLTNRTSGEQVRTTGDGQGAFEFIALEPAVYSLGVSSPGFNESFGASRWRPERTSRKASCCNSAP